MFLTPPRPIASKRTPFGKTTCEAHTMSEEPGRSDRSFEERLQAARSKAGLGTPPDAENSASGGGLGPFGVALRAGTEMISALLVALAIGYGLDYWLHTRPAFLIVFVLLGGAAGVLNVWRVFAPKEGPSRRPK
jgi:ATP synthase protein I